MRAPNESRPLPDIPPHPLPVDQVVIEIVADPANRGGRLVLQDGVESSYIDILRPDRLGFEYQRHLASVIDVVHPRRLPLGLMQIGGGPCAVVRYLEATRREMRALVAEIDAGVVEVAERHLGLVQSPRIRVHVGDGRALLATVPEASFDVLIVDAFIGLVVPHALTTGEFVAAARSALRPGGLHLTNIIDIPPHGYAKALVATLRASYAQVVVLADPVVVAGESSGNLVVAASDRPIPVEVVARRASRDPDPWQALSGRALARWSDGAALLHDAVQPEHDLARFGDLFGRTRRPRPREHT